DDAVHHRGGANELAVGFRETPAGLERGVLVAGLGPTGDHEQRRAGRILVRLAARRDIRNATGKDHEEHHDPPASFCDLQQLTEIEFHAFPFSLRCRRCTPVTWCARNTPELYYNQPLKGAALRTARCPCGSTPMMTYRGAIRRDLATLPSPAKARGGHSRATVPSRPDRLREPASG